MMRSSRLAALVALAVALACTAAGAQPPSGSDTLRREVERRFDVLPVRDGIVLHPKSPRAGVRSIEITSDSISPASSCSTRAASHCFHRTLSTSYAILARLTKCSRA